MHLVEIFLPLNDNQGNSLPQSLYDQVRAQLVQEFKGLTTYSRAPVEGIWKAPDQTSTRDSIVIYEVLVPQLDRLWWADFRKKLEGLFRQETVLVRASEVETF